MLITERDTYKQMLLHKKLNQQNNLLEQNLNLENLCQKWSKAGN